MKWKIKKKIILILAVVLFFGYKLNAQITSGIELSFNSVETKAAPTKILQYEIKHPGYGISFNSRAHFLKLYNVFDLYLGASIGYDYNIVNNVNYHFSPKDSNIPTEHEIYRTESGLKLGLSYLDNKVFLISIFLKDWFLKLVYKTGLYYIDISDQNSIYIKAINLKLKIQYHGSILISIIA